MKEVEFAQQGRFHGRVSGMQKMTGKRWKIRNEISPHLSKTCIEKNEKRRHENKEFLV